MLYNTQHLAWQRAARGGNKDDKKTMNRFVKVIENQKRELEILLKTPDIVDRTAESRLILDSSLAQIVSGIRRSGKSVLCRMALCHAGVSFGYVDFDDEHFGSIQAEDLDEILKAVYVNYGDVQHLFFDEIQNVPGWQLFVNRLLRWDKRVILTGSNSRLMTDDLATHLTGRYIATELMPFSFAEYRTYLKRTNSGVTPDLAELRRDYDRYFVNGGMPESFRYPDVRQYVSTLYDAILLRDVLKRHRLRNNKAFLDAAYVLMSNFASEVSCLKLARQLGLKNAVTVQQYIGYLEESYLIRTLNAYGSKAYERTRIGKAYVIDSGFITYFTGFSNASGNYGRRLENLVFLQLYRMQAKTDSELFFWKDQRHEVDFVIRRYGRIVKLIQVSYDISDANTRARELSALYVAGAKLKCDDLVLITDHETGVESKNGNAVKILEISTWLATVETDPAWLPVDKPMWEEEKK